MSAACSMQVALASSAPRERAVLASCARAHTRILSPTTPCQADVFPPCSIRLASNINGLHGLGRMCVAGGRRSDRVTSRGARGLWRPGNLREGMWLQSGSACHPGCLHHRLLPQSAASACVKESGPVGQAGDDKANVYENNAVCPVALEASSQEFTELHASQR